MSPAVFVCLGRFRGVVLVLHVVTVVELIRRCISGDGTIDPAQDLGHSSSGTEEWIASIMRPICTLRSAMLVPLARESMSACSRPAAIMPVFTSTVVPESTRVSKPFTITVSDESHRSDRRGHALDEVHAVLLRPPLENPPVGSLRDVLHREVADGVIAGSSRW